MKQERKIKPRRVVKRITTVEDILAQDDVNGLLADLEEKKPDINEMMVIYTDREGDIHWRFSSDVIRTADAVYWLEVAKTGILSDEDEE